MTDEPLLAVRVVTEALTALGIRYFIGGSIASSTHGEIRTTNDADIVVEMEPIQVRELVRRLGETFYADEDVIVSGLRSGRSSNVIHLPSMFKVDLFPSKGRPFDRMRFERRLRMRIDPDSKLEAFVSTVEDTILAKLLWFREGGEASDRQLRDVRGMHEVHRGRLDDQYLKHWASELGIADLLQRASSG